MLYEAQAATDIAVPGILDMPREPHTLSMVYNTNQNTGASAFRGLIEASYEN